MIEKLLKKESYLPEFEKLRSRLKSKDIKLLDYEVNSSITLAWTLYNEDFIIKELIKDLKQKKYQSPTAIERKVNIEGKDRMLYAFDWHEKILQGAVAELLDSIIAPKFSDSLHSYRKGRGQHNTLIKLSNYIRSFDQEQSLYILKRDIKGYGDNIPHEQLAKVLQEYVPKDDYLFEVIMKIIKFKYQEYGTNELKQKEKGLPTGSPINNVIVNMFLMDMDRKIDSYSKDSCYFRYSDDILVATPNKAISQEISIILRDTISYKELIFNEEKIRDLTFDRTSKRDESFKYLGLMVKSDGELTLTKEKDKKIKDQIKRTILKMDKMISRITKDKEDKVRGLIKSARSIFYNTELLQQLTSYFPIVNDDKYWTELDLWMAKVILSSVYGQHGDKVFKRYPFSELRKKGLPSIRHLRRLYIDDRKRFYDYMDKGQKKEPR